MMLLLIDITIWLFIYGLFGDLYVVNTFAFPTIIVFNALVILDYFVAKRRTKCKILKKH